MKKDTIKVGMKPAHPGNFIREEVINELGLTIKAAAKIFGVRDAALSDFLNEKAALSPEMALRLEKGFNMDMDAMLRMQAWYDAHMMRQRADKIIFSLISRNIFKLFGSFRTEISRITVEKLV